MPNQRSSARAVAAVSAVMLMGLVAGCSKSADQGDEAFARADSSQASTIPKAKTASKLGDLSAYRSIATDVPAMVDMGDLSAAKLRIKDLEVSWDSAEAGLKRRAADDWHMLDKAIDKSLSVLRANGTSQTDCKAAMTILLRTFDTLQGNL